MGDERCFLCAFSKDGRCTQTWRFTVLVEPLGGQVDFQTTPGMVPEHLKEKLSKYFGDITSLFLIPLIEKIPLWDEIREFQLESPEREGCPARQEREDLKPFLRVVPTPQ